MAEENNIMYNGMKFELLGYGKRINEEVIQYCTSAGQALVEAEGNYSCCY